MRPPHPGPESELRVLHLVPYLFGEAGVYGGAERHTTELARAMARRTPTRVVGFGLSRRQWREGDLEIFRLRNRLTSPKFVNSPAGLGLWRHFRWADVIHCHQMYTMGTSLALIYHRLTGKPVFLSDHAGGGVSLDRWLHIESVNCGRLWESRLSQGVSKVPPRPCDQVIYGGVDADRFVPAADPRPGGPVLFVGRVLEFKGLRHLIAAVDETTPVSIVGSTPDATHLTELRELARGKQVTFSPAVDGEALVEIYQRAGCVVMPGYETLGLAALEGMACGRPLIVSHTTGVAEVLDGGSNGWVEPFADPAAWRARIAWIREHPAEAAAAGRAARERVLAGYTWNAVADRCFTAYATATSTEVGDSTRHKSAGASATR